MNVLLSKLSVCNVIVQWMHTVLYEMSYHCVRQDHMDFTTLILYDQLETNWKEMEMVRKALVSIHIIQMEGRLNHNQIVFRYSFQPFWSRVYRHYISTQCNKTAAQIFQNRTLFILYCMVFYCSIVILYCLLYYTKGFSESYLVSHRT